MTGVGQITEQDAVDIYRDLFWNDPALHLNKIDGISERLAVALFDFAVNSGTPNAIRTLQETLGVIGPQTIYAISNYQGDLIGDYLDDRLDFFDKIVANDPTQQTFLNGWRNRVQHLRDHIDQEFGQYEEPTPTPEPNPQPPKPTPSPPGSPRGLGTAHDDRRLADDAVMAY